MVALLGGCSMVLLVLAVNIHNAFSKKVHVLNPDTSDIQRPCSTDNLSCIRNYFLKRRWCQIGKREDPRKPYKVNDAIHSYVPFLNATSVEKDVVISGLGNGKITEFYVNKKTETAVFSIKFKNILFRGSAVIKYHRNEREPITFYGPDIKETHPLIEITTTLPDKMKSIFEDQDVNSYATIQEAPTYDFGEGIDDIKDPEMLAILDELQTDLPRLAQELNGPRVPIFVNFYIRNIICS